MTTISIHQPGYFPWLGFFGKIVFSDVFVFLDDIQYEKNGWQNRNKIRVEGGEMWLTIPIKSKFGIFLKDVEIDNSSNWAKKHSKSISLNYSKSKFFTEYWKDLENIYKKKFEYLIDLNLEIIGYIMEKLNIKTRTVLSSELNISDAGSNRILKICKELTADSYISGISGKDYLKLDDFKKNNIQVKFQNFQHPSYTQVYEPFYPNMSTIDLLFNEGKNAEKILNQAKNF